MAWPRQARDHTAHRRTRCPSRSSSGSASCDNAGLDRVGFKVSWAAAMISIYRDQLLRRRCRHFLNGRGYVGHLIRKGTRRYAKEVPGERVQMDTCKIAPGVYQYTAVDD